MRRLLRRDRGFHGLIVVLLGLGIGSSTLVFSVVNEVLLKPLPVRDSGNLYLLARTTPGEFRPDEYFDARHYREVVLRNPLVQSAVAEQMADPRSIVPLRESGRARLVQAQAVSPNYFRELGVRPLIGRLLDDSDTGVAAVLSYHFWQSEYNGDRAVIGRTLRLRDTVFTIVGVLPREFHSSDIDRAPEVRITMAAAATLFGRDPNGVSYRLLARLVPGTDPSAAGASLLAPLRQMDEALAAAREAKPDPDSRRFTILVKPIERGVSRMRDQFSSALRLLLGGVGVLLFAVCANVAGLLIAKSGERRREIGIRMALGAGRRQIVGQLLGESLALGLGGALLGSALYWLAAGQLVSLLPPARDLAQYASPQLLTLSPDWRVLAFAVAATLFVVLASGLVPAWRAARVDLVSEIKVARGRRRRSGVVTVALQAAFSMALLAAAGLMLRTWSKLDRLDAGFDRAHLVSFTIDPASAGYKMEQVGAIATELRRRVDILPGVRSTAWAWRALMRGSGIKTTVAPEGIVLPPSTFLNSSINEVTPGYFEAMGMRLLEGRDLQLADAGQKLLPVVVNQALAAQLYPGQSAIGKRLVQGKDGTKPPNRVIVGVVNTAKYRSMREPDPATIYSAWDVAKGTDWQFHLHVRTYGAPASIVGAVRQALHDVDPGVPLVEAATMESEVQASLWQERLVAVLAAFFGVTAVALAGIGLYASLALSVAQRRREIGIRVAVGARRRHLATAICSPMAIGIGSGIVAGLVGSVWLLRLTRGLLFGVDPFDPLSVAAAVAIVLLASALAAALPLRRAARVDPATALRQE